MFYLSLHGTGLKKSETDDKKERNVNLYFTNMFNVGVEYLLCDERYQFITD